MIKLVLGKRALSRAEEYYVIREPRRLEDTPSAEAASSLMPAIDVRLVQSVTAE
ncbi:hypothetical protein [Sphingomonas faeni]|uniref:hypothetical protein n=1 Tax=Sphingomonas faeni TaxID=185950 RepID=UPI002413743D|nr:hypothetical protein [Sphingomonas faeni]